MIAYKDLIKQAPLPFMGQKRNAIKPLYECFKEAGYKPKRVIDLFGGSGLLSNFFKQMYPEAEVIYNDYDDYMNRVEMIPKTNRMLQELRKIVHNQGGGRNKQFDTQTKNLIQEYLESVGEYDRATIHAGLSVRGSMKLDIYCNKIRLSDYEVDERYLSGVERVKCDYKELIGKDDAFYILDPPYIQTEHNIYKGWFSIGDFLELYDWFKDVRNYVFFTSRKSGAYDLMRYFYPQDEGFKHIIEFKGSSSAHKRTDEIIYIKHD